MKQKLMMEQAGRLKPEDQPAKPSGVDVSGMPDLVPGDVDDTDVAEVTAHPTVPAERIVTPRRPEDEAFEEEEAAMDEDTVAKPGAAGTPVDDSAACKPVAEQDEDDLPLQRMLPGKLPCIMFQISIQTL